MSKIIKAEVINGRYKGEVVRITNVSVDERGKKNAACFLSNGTRANISVEDLSIIPEKEDKQTDTKFAKTASMPFVSGSSSSRTLTHTKNMNKSLTPPSVLDICETCGARYNVLGRRGQPGKITECPSCASEDKINKP